jgi:hypothetical protein
MLDNALESACHSLIHYSHFIFSLLSLFLL